MKGYLCLSLALLAIAVASESLGPDSGEQQCLGKPPMESVATFLGMELDYNIADRICCHNHRYAEPKGYQDWPEVDFYAKLDPTKEHVFYDSVCGIPLFVAPRGRTFDEFVAESKHHGWPSFRPAEIVSENVIIHPGGRMESKCLTHLGHNLPSGGEDRYCIDLVCMAGSPIDNATVVEGEDGSLATIVNGVENTDGVISASEFDAGTYESSAETNSGKHPMTKQTIGWVVGSILALVLLVAFVYFQKRKREKNQQRSVPEQQYSDEKQKDEASSGTNSENDGAGSEE